MSPDPSRDGIDCIGLALAFARTPSRFPDLLHGRQSLPPGVTALLQIAAENPISGLETSEQQQAARFFIEEVLLAHHADHYRVLGVVPSAPAEQIKEHHRLLIRLFHPDRRRSPEARTDAFATRINQAYNILRSTEKRANYDRTLIERQGAKPSPRRPQFVPPPDFPMGPPSFVTRHRTIFAIGGVALAAMIGVILTTVNQVPAGAIGASGSHLSRSSDSGASYAAAPELPQTALRAPPEAPPVTLATHNEPSSVSAPPHETSGTAIENLRKPEPTPIPVAVKTASTMVAPPLVQAIKASIPERLSAPIPAKEATPNAAVEQTTPISGAVPASKAERITPEPMRIDLLNQLVSSFSERYQRGDLESLLALFDQSARIERGDINHIRAEYGELFRSTENRTLNIWDMAWTSDGRVTRGNGSFQARVLEKGSHSHRVYNGVLTFEVIQRDDRTLIVRLNHRTD